MFRRCASGKSAARFTVVRCCACVVAALAAGLAVRGVTAEQMHVRLDPTELPPERVPLAASFNSMLDQLQASVTRLSHFSSDSAHKLRMPLTKPSTQTQVALSQPRDAAAYRELL